MNVWELPQVDEALEDGLRVRFLERFFPLTPEQAEQIFGCRHNLEFNDDFGYNGKCRISVKGDFATSLCQALSRFGSFSAINPRRPLIPKHLDTEGAVYYPFG